MSVKGGPGGTGYFTTIQALRNATGYSLITTGTTVNTSVSQASAKVMAGGAITTWNITLPSPAYDGEDVAVACPGGIGINCVCVAHSATGWSANRWHRIHCLYLRWCRC